MTAPLTPPLPLAELVKKWRDEAKDDPNYDTASVQVLCANELEASLPLGRCETCRHWCAGKSQGEAMRAAYICNGWDGECGKKAEFRRMFTIYVYGDGRVDDYEFDTPPSFSCAFHEAMPAPPAAGEETR